MSAPRKAVVLAAGLGMRLRPLTQGCPKPLMPVWGVPLLERALRLLEGWGVEEVAVNLHWQAERVRAFLAGRQGGAAVRESYEPEILGTGGALRPLRGFLGEEPFWVLNADIAAVVEAGPLLRAFEAGGGFGAAWLEPKKGPRTVEADRCGRITCYRSPTPGVAGTYTFCGLQLLSPEVYGFLPEGPFSTLVQAYERALEAGRCVRGVAVPGSFWDDAGTLDAYLRIHGDAKRGARAGGPAGTLYEARFDRLGPQEAGFFCVGEGAAVDASAAGRDSVVTGPAAVEAGAVLDGSVVTGGRVGGVLEGVACVAAGEVADEALPAALAVLGWAPGEVAAAWLGARGSERTFWRLYRGSERAIYIRYGLGRPENARYAGHAALLAGAGVPVPAVLADLPEARALVLEDWGDDSLQRRMEAGRGRAAQGLYRPVVEALARLHGAGTRAARAAGVVLEPAFDAALYAWERRLFEEQMLEARYGVGRLPPGVVRELEDVAGRLLQAPPVLVHRDFQSSNILFRGEAFALIDFQGMRLGAAAYDLASLVYDPYVTLSASLRNRLIAHYGACPTAQPDGAGLVHVAAVQRLVQALGAFGRLTALGQPGFVRHVLPALGLLLEAADAGGYDAVGGLAEELIAREQRRAGV